MLIVDACVALKFITPGAGREAALDRIDRESTVTAPDWILVEIGNALRRKSLRGEFDDATAIALLGLVPQLVTSMRPTAPLVGNAMALSFDLDHWIYDCIYLACALDLDAPLLTADRKFWNAAKRAGYGDVVELLSWEEQAD